LRKKGFTIVCIAFALRPIDARVVDGTHALNKALDDSSFLVVYENVSRTPVT
jgi:hypothetical protein